MKALTLTQPWATLVAIGAKRVETRSWSSSYRGPVAIHAAKTVPTWARHVPHEWPFGMVLRDADIQSDANGDPDLPRGAIVAVARIVEIVPTSPESNERVLAVYGGRYEYEFGDYSRGRYAWALADIRPLLDPIPCRGALSLWDLPEDTEERLDFQLLGTPDPSEAAP
jgi:hypothetical protein